MNDANTCKWKVRLLFFCHQDVSRFILLLIPSFNLFGSSHGPLTAADLFSDMGKKKLT